MVEILRQVNSNKIIKLTRAWSLMVVEALEEDEMTEATLEEVEPLEEEEMVAGRGGNAC